MKSLSEYINENINVSLENLIIEEGILDWFKKIWNWMFGAVKENTKENNGKYIIPEKTVKNISNNSAEIFSIKIDIKEFNQLIAESNSNKMGGAFSKAVKWEATHNDITIFVINDKNAIILPIGFAFCDVNEKKETSNWYIALSSQLTDKIMPKKFDETIAKSLEAACKKAGLSYNETKIKINESGLDIDNFNWKIDTYFSRDENQRKLFNELMTNKNIDDAISNGFDIKDFVNFMYDDINPESEKDYKYQMNKLITYFNQKAKI